MTPEALGEQGAERVQQCASSALASEESEPGASAISSSGRAIGPPDLESTVDVLLDAGQEQTEQADVSIVRFEA